MAACGTPIGQLTTGSGTAAACTGRAFALEKPTIPSLELALEVAISCLELTLEKPTIPSLRLAMPTTPGTPVEMALEMARFLDAGGAALSRGARAVPGAGGAALSRGARAVPGAS
jgi:hypothetical protein